MGAARRRFGPRDADRTSERGVSGEGRVFALGDPTLVPGVLAHEELYFVDVAAVAVVHLVPAGVFDIAQALRDAQRGDVVGAELDPDTRQVEVVEEIPMQC